MGGNPYCVLAGSRRITFLSSGGNGVLSCEDERHAAEQAESKARDSRTGLKRVPYLPLCT